MTFANHLPLNRPQGEATMAIVNNFLTEKGVAIRGKEGVTNWVYLNSQSMEVLGTRKERRREAVQAQKFVRMKEEEV